MADDFKILFFLYYNLNANSKMPFFASKMSPKSIIEEDSETYILLGK